MCRTCDGTGVVVRPSDGEEFTCTDCGGGIGRRDDAMMNTEHGRERMQMRGGA